MNSLYTVLIKLLVLQSVISENVKEKGENTVNEFSDANEGSRVLSRRKRYVIFPDGSSFQLVFCNQISNIVHISDIFLFSFTAALAWPLPSDPKYVTMLKGNENALRRSDQGSKTVINYYDEDGRIFARVPLNRKTIVPAFAKRSIDNKLSYKEKLKIMINRQEMHQRHMNRDYLKSEYMDKDTIEFHRSNRLDLYGRLESLITTLGGDGRQCVLYKLCEAAQRRQKQGTFLQEFLGLVFTLPKGELFKLDEHKEYDAAHTPSDDCLVRYPRCIPDYQQ